jgi:hypothetical protein
VVCFIYPGWRLTDALLQGAIAAQTADIANIQLGGAEWVLVIEKEVYMLRGLEPRSGHC